MPAATAVARDAIGEQRRARDRVRPAARVAPHREPVESERVGERGDVRGVVRDRPRRRAGSTARRRVGPARSSRRPRARAPVVGPREAGAARGRAVEHHHRRAGRDRRTRRRRRPRRPRVTSRGDRDAGWSRRVTQAARRRRAACRARVRARRSRPGRADRRARAAGPGGGRRAPRRACCSPASLSTTHWTRRSVGHDSRSTSPAATTRSTSRVVPPLVSPSWHGELGHVEPAAGGAADPQQHLEEGAADAARTARASS